MSLQQVMTLVVFAENQTLVTEYLIRNWTTGASKTVQKARVGFVSLFNCELVAMGPHNTGPRTQPVRLEIYLFLTSRLAPSHILHPFGALDVHIL